MCVCVCVCVIERRGINTDGYITVFLCTISSFISYSYTQPSSGVGCDSVTQQCVATIPNERLRQRIWYIDDTKSRTGKVPVVFFACLIHYF